MCSLVATDGSGKTVVVILLLTVMEMGEKEFIWNLLSRFQGITNSKLSGAGLQIPLSMRREKENIFGFYWADMRELQIPNSMERQLWR
ncbi:MAG: hypothetical protein WCI92_02405 [Bacteroidota bacterium]